MTVIGLFCSMAVDSQVSFYRSTLMVDIPSLLRVRDCVSTARLFLNHIGMLGIESVQVRPP